jgi:hypothetical protein
MPERPIIFSGPMVRAILAGTKMQTRRVVQPQPPAGHAWAGWCVASTQRADEGKATWGAGSLPHLRAAHRVACRYGRPGDRLWVREAWRVGRKHDGTKPSDLSPRSMTVEYEAGGYACNSPWSAGEWQSSDCAPREHPEWVGKLRPPIHMPRWASRITLEVTGVRVERLQDVSAADFWAEGIEHSPDVDPVHEYSDLWRSIYGPGSWASNPWVWVVEFQRVDSEARQP